MVTLKDRIRARRRGNIMLVLMLGTLLVVVVLSMLTVASSLYRTSQDSAETYSEIQRYRATSEILVYQYITDLESVTITKDLDAEWLSFSGNAVYTQALEALVASLAPPENSRQWFVTDVIEALRGVAVSNPLVLQSLIEEYEGIRQSFSLTVPEPLRLDWMDSKSWSNRHGAIVSLDPVLIELTLVARGETITEKFLVDGLFLEIQRIEIDVGGDDHDAVTMMIREMEEGVTISRVVST